jgi:CubicO group peptidase (beta-lactamase class C family)
MCIDSGSHDGGELVGRKMFDTMEGQYIPLSWRVFGNESYGYGWWMIPDFFGCKLVEHTGWLGVSSAFVGYVREKKIGVAILGNPAGGLEQIGHFAIAQLIGEDPQKLPAVWREKILKRLEGNYETYKGTIRFTVKKEGDILLAEFKNKYIEERYPKHWKRTMPCLPTFRVEPS